MKRPLPCSPQLFSARSMLSVTTVFWISVAGERLGRGDLEAADPEIRGRPCPCCRRSAGTSTSSRTRLVDHAARRCSRTVVERVVAVRAAAAVPGIAAQAPPPPSACSGRRSAVRIVRARERHPRGTAEPGERRARSSSADAPRAYASRREGHRAAGLDERHELLPCASRGRLCGRRAGGAGRCPRRRTTPSADAEEHRAADRADAASVPTRAR